MGRGARRRPARRHRGRRADRRGHRAHRSGHRPGAHDDGAGHHPADRAGRGRARVPLRHPRAGRRRRRRVRADPRDRPAAVGSGAHADGDGPARLRGALRGAARRGATPHAAAAAHAHRPDPAHQRAARGAAHDAHGPRDGVARGLPGPGRAPRGVHGRAGRARVPRGRRGRDGAAGHRAPARGDRVRPAHPDLLRRQRDAVRPALAARRAAAAAARAPVPRALPARARGAGVARRPSGPAVR